MNSMRFALKKFDLFKNKREDGEGALLYTPEISAHIKNQNLVRLLEDIKESNVLEIDESLLNNIIEKHDLDPIAVKKYLVNELELISMFNEVRFNKLFINSDNKQVNDALVNYFSRGYGLKTYSEIDSQEVTADSIVLVFNSVYSPKKIIDIYTLCKQKNSWVITAYIANHYLVIDNIFNANKGVPCHFCNFNRHQNIVASKNNLKKTSWINFCRRAITEDIHVLPAINLTHIECGLITYWLAKSIKNFIDPRSYYLLMNEISRYSWVNLTTGEMNQEQAVHWSCCDCLQ